MQDSTPLLKYGRHSAEDSDHGRNYAYVSHYYRVIIKSYHLHTSFFFFMSGYIHSPTGDLPDLGQADLRDLHSIKSFQDSFFPIVS